MKVVLDTNIWISGLLWGGVPAQIIRLVDRQQIQIAISEPLLAELEATLRYAKLQPRLRSLNVSAETLMVLVQQLVELSPTVPLIVENLRDPKNAIVLAAAITSNADVVITGDRDLLVLNSFSGIAIATPQDFLN